MDKGYTLTLEEIRRLTGHESTDAVRMALKRAGVSASTLQVGIGKGTWPPKKAYDVHKVWQTFGSRILRQVQADPGIKDFCWEVFQKQITLSAHGQAASDVFADKLN